MTHKAKITMPSTRVFSEMMNHVSLSGSLIDESGVLADNRRKMLSRMHSTFGRGRIMVWNYFPGFKLDTLVMLRLQHTFALVKTTAHTQLSF